MRWLRDFALVVCTLLVAALAATAPALSQSQHSWHLKSLNETIDQTNFKVNRGCSGTLVDAKQGLILTAYHCIEDQYETVEREKISEDGKVEKEKVRRHIEGQVHQLVLDGAKEIGQVTYRFKIVTSDASNDLALLQVYGKLPNTMAAPIACEAPLRGAPVYIVGNPQGLYSSVTLGFVSSVQRTYGAIPFGDSRQADNVVMQVSGGVVGGNSGGAVYNGYGELVGVPVFGNRMNEVIAFTVPLSVVREFLKAKPMELAPCGSAK